MFEALRLIKWCDVFWQNNLSLRTLWPVLFLRRPVVITHQGSYARQPVGWDFWLRVKQVVANRQTSVAVSSFVASFFKTGCVIVPNPYDADLFVSEVPISERRRELIFLGRLVSEKGLDLLLESLGLLQARGVRPRLTVVGSGPELSALQDLARRRGLGKEVTFAGWKQAAELVEILNLHQILVVPSRGPEPFGVVALEGIGCGCAVVGSSGGGLPEAIGPCGTVFSNGDPAALAQVLETLLTQPDERQRLASQGPRHLARFRPGVIAETYLDLFRSKLS